MDDFSLLCHFLQFECCLCICICWVFASPFQIFQLVAGGTIPSVSQGFQEASGRQVPEISRPSLTNCPGSWDRPWNTRDFLGILCQIAVQCTPCFLRFRKKKPSVFADVAPFDIVQNDRLRWLEGKSPATFLDRVEWSARICLVMDPITCSMCVVALVEATFRAQKTTPAPRWFTSTKLMQRWSMCERRHTLATRSVRKVPFC